MNIGIYLIENTISKKKYVGSSKNLNEREHKHFSELRRHKHPNPHLQNAYNKYGKEAFHFMTIEYCDPELLLKREDYWIAHYDSMNPDKGYNLRTAERQHPSEETKAKIGAASKGNQYNLGRKLSDETKAKMSAAQKGKLKSEEHKAKLAAGLRERNASEKQRTKISAAMKGRPKSEEHKARLSAAKKGKPNGRVGYKHSEETKAKMSAAKKDRNSNDNDA